MRHMGEPRGETRVCNACDGRKWTEYYYAQLPDKMYNPITQDMENYGTLYFEDCQYCAGLGYKEACY